MIPHEKTTAVTRALDEAFGVTAYEDIRKITKGHTTALVFRIVVKGSPFLMRIIMRPNAMVGPERHFGCMRAAAEAGVAPRVLYASVEDGIAITDFVEEAPFPATEALVRMPAVLRALHALPPFPTAEHHLNTSCMFLMNQAPAVEAFIRSFRAANILPPAETEELMARHNELFAVYPRLPRDMVSSHNDLFKPDNILFDGKRVWLVDWEAAFLNDRYADLAVVANLVVTNHAEEKLYLREYFGQAPNRCQLARFFLARQVSHLFYAMVFLLIGSAGKPVDLNANTAELEEFYRGFRAGQIDLGDSRTKSLYGRVHLEQLLHDTRQARYTEALRIVSGENAERSVA